MTRGIAPAGRRIAGLAALLLALTAALHATGYASIRRLAEETQGDLSVLSPLLWIAFSIDLTALAIVAALVAWRPGGAGRFILAGCALPPLGAAWLQVATLGFIFPTALLLLDAALLILAAVLLRDRPATAPR